MLNPSESAHETLEGILTATERGATLDMGLLLSRVLALGFKSCRYYDVALNVPTPEPVLILTAFAGDTVHKLRYKIPYKDSTLAHAANPRRAALGSSTAGALPQFVDDLGLAGRSWVDVPVLYQDRLIGLIAVDWQDVPHTPAVVRDTLLLEFIALRVANAMFAQPIPVPIAQLEGIGLTATPVDLIAHLQEAGKEICRSLSAATVSIFEHHWQSNSIVKVFEEVHIDYHSRRADFPETYSPSKNSLTWQAWENERVRHVADFQEFQHTHPELTDSACMHRHETLLGGISSILYSVLGVRERRFLIRVMNRVDEPDLPFVTRHAQLLDLMSARLSSFIDHATAHARFRRLERTARALCGKQATQPRDALQIILQTLEAEGITNFAVFTRAKSGTQRFRSIERAGPLLKHWDCSAHLRSDFDSDRFFTRCSQFDVPKVVDARSFPEHTVATHLLGFLIKERVEWLVACPFEGYDISGVVACPLVVDGISDDAPRTRSQPVLGPQREGVLATYAAMLGSALESIESSLTTEGARNLIGHIGHEVNTPVILMGQEALYAIALSRQASAKDPEALRELTSAERNVQEHMRTIQKTMVTATLVGQTAKRRLELELRRYDVMELLNTAQSRLRNDLDVVTPDGARRLCQIDVSDACTRMGQIVCDRDHLLTVLQNVLGNAIKYSLPPSGQRNKAMLIRIRGLFQTNLVIFQIVNRGRGIAPEDRELIFLPFVRGTVRTQTRMTRGMGLGLYISRRIAVAHGGSLFCQRSEFVEENPALKSKWEGFETTFELRISRTLHEGVTEFTWDEES